jgi:cobalt-zinc-cadmium efflux system outer membrane protein
MPKDHRSEEGEAVKMKAVLSNPYGNQRRARCISLFPMFTLVCSYVCAQHSSTLTLPQLEQMALVNNPSIAQAQANVQAAQGLSKQAGLYPNPTVGYYSDEIRGGSFSGGKQGGFVSQTIVLGGKLRAARRVAELETNEVETTEQTQRLRIVNNVRALFYRVLAAQRMVELRKHLAGVAADAARTSQQLMNVGQADQPDILQAEVEEQQADVSLRLAQQNLHASWQMLAATVGKPSLAPVSLAGDLDSLPDLSYEESLAATLRDSPEVKLAQEETIRSQAALTLARKTPIPDLELTGLLVQNFEPLETSSRQVGAEAGIQIGVQLPLFNRNQGAIAAARASVESARQDLSRVQLQKRRELTGLFSDYDSSRALAEQYKTQMLPRAKQAYELYQKNYRKMAGAYPQVLISQRTLFQLEVEYIQALDSAWQTVLAIRGFGLMDGLSQPPGPAMAPIGALK